MMHYRVIGKNGMVIDVVAPSMRHAILIGFRSLGIVKGVVRGKRHA